jgi:hypothetical protein
MKRRRPNFLNPMNCLIRRPNLFRNRFYKLFHRRSRRRRQRRQRSRTFLKACLEERTNPVPGAEIKAGVC